MDPLLRATVSLQELLARTLGTAVTVLLGATLVAHAREPIGSVGPALLVGVYLVILGRRLHRRLVRLAPLETTRLDLELFTHLGLGVYAALLAAPGGLDGPWYPAAYAAVTLAAAFARPLAVVGTVLFALGLEAALGDLALGRPIDALLPHAALLVTFASMNAVVFRAELTRVRRLSRARLDGELRRLRDDARVYRLHGAASSVAPAASIAPASAERGDPERLIRSSVDHIHDTLELALRLLRRALGLRSAALVWIGAGGRELVVREISTDEAEIERGPFRPTDGLFGAVGTSGEPVTVTGARARRLVPYYRTPSTIEALCAFPVREQGEIRGYLMVDRDEPVPFGEGDLALLGALSELVLRTVGNERVVVQLERAKTEQGKLYRAVDLLAAAATEAQVIEAGVASAREFAAFDFAAVTILGEAGGHPVHEICAASGDGAAEICGQSFRQNSGLVSMVVANRHPLPYRGDYDAARQVVFTRRLRPPDVPSLVVLPLVVRDDVLGTLVLGSSQKGALGDTVRPMLEVLARHVAVSLANARMVKRLEDLATTDGLTGLYNKRTLIDLGGQKIRAAERFARPLSVLVADIDHFKKVNDTHGHDMGDIVIKGLGDVLRRTKRDTDVVGRFGGEEFVVVCEGTDAEGARQLAERIRSELAATTFHTPGGPLAVTCSIGVATFPLAGSDWDALFKATDEALYASKRGGRNRVTTWTSRLRGVAA
ncbi:MAG: GGDEF domain-containing protein [Deltaproteobacteria bacterium]|nr:GGDEF domain-containing protein [Deltaproteobacteria bacterium]